MQYSKNAGARRALAGISFAAAAAAFIAFHGNAEAAPTATLPSTGTIAVPTYESAGIYWQSPGGTAGCEVKFRAEGESAWRQGLALWYDARDSQCRGSLVNLTPGTYYQVELNLPGQAASRGLVFKTWSNTAAVAKTITVNSASGSTYDITEGGSPTTGYVVYQGASGAVLDGQNSANYNITVNASYVIIRGLTLKGAKADAIRLSPNVTDVIIEDNDISGWGRTRDGKWGTDMDSAVRAVCSTPSLTRVTVQRNRIHDPRYSANSWSDGHPAGPQAIAFAHCGGNHVFRHNEIFSSNGNYFNDIIGGEDNFTKAGFPNSDTDIYGNRLSHAWDDAIEAEGANENVRIWGNYIDRTALGVATTATSVGPVYIFRNVWNRSQFKQNISSLDADDRQPFFKSGGTMELGHGRRYVFHNTMLQARQSGLQYGLGGGFGLGGTGSTQLIENTWSRNNIYHQWKDGKGFTYQTGSTSSFVADMYNGTPGDATVKDGIAATPVYASGHGWQSEANGQYQLASGSPGFGKGVKIANFNDGVAAPDVGAHQSGTPAMKFGIGASPGSSVSGPGSLPPSDPTPTPTDPTPPPPDSSTPTAPSGSGVTASTTSLQFGTVQGTQTVTYTNNTSSKVTFIQASLSSGKFGQSNTCGEVAPGASCTATITYYPSQSGSTSATYTLTSTAPNSPHVVSLAASTTTTTNPTSPSAPTLPSNDAGAAARVAMAFRGGDFNADGKDDLAWRRTSDNQHGAWLMNGAAAPTPAGFYPPGASVAHQMADYNGDGKADLLYRDKGVYRLAIMNGLNVASTTTIHAKADGWEVVGKGDFNGDGKVDLLWKRASGAIHGIWLMNGATALQVGALASPGSGWNVEAVGDFNGDGKDDVLWRNPAVGVRVQLMNGLAAGASAAFAVAGNWMPQFVGDFNGDGKADLLWKRTGSTEHGLWLMNGTVQIAATGFNGPASGTVHDVADFNGDGKDDLLWRGSNGSYHVALMNGTAATSTTSIFAGDGYWEVVGHGDYNGDGKADLFWRSKGNSYGLWIMNGGTAVSTALVLGGGTAWEKAL